jgi:voltage-gated potassium channel
MVTERMEFTVHFLRIFVLDLLNAAPVLGFLLMAIGSIGVIIGRIEGWTVSEGLYHAFINATTVGYGDFRPSETKARALAVVLAFVGLVFTGMIVAIAIHSSVYAYDLIYDQDVFKGPVGR